jgi:hypothetical protein
MNGISKIVVSRTLDKAEWANTRLINGPEELHDAQAAVPARTSRSSAAPI